MRFGIFIIIGLFLVQFSLWAQERSVPLNPNSNLLKMAKLERKTQRVVSRSQSQTALDLLNKGRNFSKLAREQYHNREFQSSYRNALIAMKFFDRAFTATFDTPGNHYQFLLEQVGGLLKKTYAREKTEAVSPLMKRTLHLYKEAKWYAAQGNYVGAVERLKQSRSNLMIALKQHIPVRSPLKIFAEYQKYFGRQAGYVRENGGQVSIRYLRKARFYLDRAKLSCDKEQIQQCKRLIEISRIFLKMALSSIQ